MTASTSKTSKDTKVADLEILIPVETKIVIDGVKCRVKRVRMRELMLLAKVVTNGGGRALQELDFKSSEFESQMLGLLLMAIPNAQDEFVELISAIVEPEEKLTREQSDAFWGGLDNPDPGDSIEILQILAVQERDTFETLLGKAKAVLGNVRALYSTGKKGS